MAMQSSIESDVEPQFLRRKAAAKLSGLSETTLKWLASRPGAGPPFYKPSNRIVLYPLVGLLRWIESGSSNNPTTK